MSPEERAALEELKELSAQLSIMIARQTQSAVENSTQFHIQRLFIIKQAIERDLFMLERLRARWVTQHDDMDDIPF